MSSSSCASQRTRGLSLEIFSIYEIGRRKVVIKIQQTSLRRTLSNSASSTLYVTPFTLNMTYLVVVLVPEVPSLQNLQIHL